MDFSYTSRGAFRKSKMVIDYTNIVLSVIVALIFIAIVFLRGKSGILFPIEFALGAVINGMACAVSFMDNKKVVGIIRLVATIVLALMAIVSLHVVLQ